MHLSPRQVQILSLISEGCSDKEIAQRLGMSARTVDSHLRRLYERHSVHSRAAIVAKWLLEGGIPQWAPEVSSARQTAGAQLDGLNRSPGDGAHGETLKTGTPGLRTTRTSGGARRTIATS